MNKNIKLLDFKLKKNLGADIFGAWKSKFHGSGLDFVEHREYVAGDSTKNIDWKASSKQDKLYVKKFEEQRNIKIHFLLDINESFYFFRNKLELLKEILYTLSISGNKNADLISFSYLEDKKVNFENYTLELASLFRIINKLDEKKIFGDLEKQIEYINKVKLENNLIFIISDKDNIEDIKKLQLISIKNEVIFINIFDYFENNLEKINGIIGFTNKKELLKINLSNKSKISEYQRLRKEKLDKLKYKLERIGISYLYIDSKLDLYKELLKFFSK